MEKIMLMKKQYICPSLDDFRIQFENYSEKEHDVSKQIQQYEECRRKIIKCREELNHQRRKLDIEAKNMEDNTKNAKQATLELQNLQSTLNDIIAETEKLESKAKSLKCNRISNSDTQLLEQGRMKLRLYKDFTGIRWNYIEIDERIKGYLTNKKDYLHSFSYSKSTSNKTDKLWNEIAIAGKKFMSE